jgi:hypothetical protein
MNGAITLRPSNEDREEPSVFVAEAERLVVDSVWLAAT